LGIGDWGVGLGPNPKPQNPIPKTPRKKKKFIKNKINIYLIN
jgi:hypothetical protein